MSFLHSLLRRARSRVARSYAPQPAPIVRAHLEATRILVFAPHPDDDTLGAGGVLLQSRRRGAMVHVVYVTSGDADPTSEVAQAREREAARVAGALGASFACWQYPTRGIPTSAAAERIRAVVAEHQPDCIVLPFLADDHPDHQAVARCFAAAYADGGAPDVDVWAYQVYSAVPPNTIVDITDVMDAKLRLVRMWESQMGKRDWAHYIAGRNAWCSRHLHTNALQYAEDYLVFPAAEYVRYCGTDPNP